ncbi:metallophosphoesterase family protein [Candidatus Neomarinimicrobiota bacterium]
MSLRHKIDRRTFLKNSALLVAVALAFGKLGPVLAQGNSSIIYSSDFVPEGASCKLAFVCDHHYWPDHLKDWGGGSQQVRHSRERMHDLIETLNNEAVDVSIHGGDVIDAGVSFYPTAEEYQKQLVFEKEMIDGFNHLAIPVIGNHETFPADYTSLSDFDQWSRYFGPIYRFHDIGGYRLITINTFLPGNVSGLDDVQMEWLKDRLSDAAAKGLKVLIFGHIAPGRYVNNTEFETLISSAGCVKGMMFGHNHRNNMQSFGGVPVMVRVSNAASPLGYTIVHLYPDGRIIIQQKSQHFPFLNFVSSKSMNNPQGSEEQRYFTLEGSSLLPLSDLSLIGEGASAHIENGHLRLSSADGTGILLIDSANLRNARLTFSAVKAEGARMGALAYAKPDGSGGVEATLTRNYSTDGQMYLAEREQSGRTTLDRNWFNIADDIAYQLIIEARNGEVKASWKNMPVLSADIGRSSGRFGIFIERGTMFVTDLKLERLP